MLRHPAVLAVALVLLALGCARSHGRGGLDPTLDGGAPVDPVGPGPGTRSVYVLTSTSPRVAEGVRADGVDLDGVVSTGAGWTCVDVAPDFVSLQDGAPGVDNMLAALVPQLGMLHGDSCPPGTPGDACLALLSTRAILSGSSLYLVEVTGIGSYADDPDVEVMLHRASVIGCDPAVPASCVPGIEGSSLAPDQTFEAVEVGRGRGSIVGGRLRVAFAAPVQIEMPLLSADAASLALLAPRLTAAITPGALSSGALAGAFDTEEMARRADERMPGAGDLVRSVLGGIADLAPDPADPTVCRQLSAALSIAAVPARIR